MKEAPARSAGQIAVSQGPIPAKLRALVVGPRDLPLASLLRLDERFTVVYEDRDGPAVVFEAK